MRLTLSTEWLSVCGGCHVSLVDKHDEIITLVAKDQLKILRSPVLVDTKDYPKADIGIICGAVRTSHDRSAAQKMRESCTTVVAFGTCAVYGGISGAGFVHKNDDILDTVYQGSKNGKRPDPNAGTGIPELEETVVPLDEVIDVDLYLPGCPPDPYYIYSAVKNLLENKPLVKKYRTVCAECERKMEKTDLKTVNRPYENGKKVDHDVCLLSQGYLCFGSVTMERCLMACPNKGVICTGCAGPSLQVLQEPNRDIRTELAERMSGLTEIPKDEIINEIEKNSKTHYAYAMSSKMIGQKPTFLIKKWLDAEEEAAR